MAIGWTYAPGHTLMDGISTWKIKVGTDTGHYSLGILKDAKVVVKSDLDRDSIGRSMPYMMNIDASAKMLGTEKATLKFLGSLGAGDVNHIITAQNAKTFKGHFGLKWKFVCSDAVRYTEITSGAQFMVDHATEADLADLLATPTPGTPVSTDIMYGFAPVTRCAGGFKKFEIAPAAGAFEQAGPIKKGSLTAEALGYVDDYGRFYLSVVKCDMDFEITPVSAELGFITSSGGQDVDVRLTGKDGLTWTFTQATCGVGTSWEIHLDSDANGPAFLKATSSVQMTPTQWAATMPA